LPHPSTLPPTTCSKNGTLYQDLGTSYFDSRSKDKQASRLVGRLKNLGFEVQIKSLAA
jgi:hypothetical protein